MSEKPIKLSRGESIVAVVPEYCRGPGWSNQVVWVYIEGDGKLRQVCLQRDEQSAEMLLMFDAGAAMHRALLGAVAVEQDGTR